MDIPLEHAMVCWNPAAMEPTRHRSEPGAIKIVEHPDRIDASGPYLYSSGACDFKMWEDPEKRLFWLLHIFNTITTRDGIDPVVAHQAFLVIPEYRRGITTDSPGATYIDDDGSERRFSNR
jgi:hypothetical protein